MSFRGSHVNTGTFKSISFSVYYYYTNQVHTNDLRSNTKRYSNVQGLRIIVGSRAPEEITGESTGNGRGRWGKIPAVMKPLLAAPFGYLWFVASLESEVISRTSSCQQAVIARWPVKAIGPALENAFLLLVGKSHKIFPQQRRWKTMVNVVPGTVPSLRTYAIEKCQGLQGVS